MVVGGLIALGGDRQALRSIETHCQANSIAVATIHILDEGQTARIKALEERHKEIMTELRYLRRRVDELILKGRSNATTNSGNAIAGVLDRLHVP